MALCERFGWTFSALDEEDMTRVYPAVGAANMRAALQRVQQWADAAAAGRKPAFPSGNELRLWQEAKRIVNA